MNTFCSEDDAPLGDPVVTNAPPVIWLNVGELDDDAEFGELGSDHGEDGVTWCDTKQFPADIRYVRADLVKDVMPTNWRDDPDWLPLARAIGITEERPK